MEFLTYYNYRNHNQQYFTKGHKKNKGQNKIPNTLNINITNKQKPLYAAFMTCNYEFMTRKERNYDWALNMDTSATVGRLNGI